MRSLPMLAGVGLLSFLALPAVAQQSGQEETWSSKVVTHFETFCYQTGASFQHAVALADMLEKQEISDKNLAGVMPLDDVEDGKGYVLELDKPGKRAILMAVVTGQDACSIAATGADQDEVMSSMSENYRLREVATNDIGLQVNTLYIPDGTSESIRESHHKGMIAIMKNKPGASVDTMTISYIPPRTAKVKF